MQKKSFLENIFQGIRFRLKKIFHNPYRELNVGPVKKIYYKHLNPGEPRIHRLFGKDLHFINATELLHGLKEIFVEEIYRQELPAKPYIIDCGANIGLSVIYMKHRHPDAEILAFEPDEQNFLLLSKNVQSFGFENVHLKKEAVWIEDKILNFSAKGSTASKLIDQSTTESVSVKAVRLKNLIDRKTDLLKIDIEGAEYQVVIDIQEKLKYVGHLFIEYHGNFNQNTELNEIFDVIVKNGFQYYIKEAAPVYDTPFSRPLKNSYPYDIQLNIFCFRN